jgi:hypothetical protein
MALYLQVAAVAALLTATGLRAQLRVGFYDNSCPAVEIIAQQEVSKAVGANPGLAAGLLRLHFHDCFVAVSSWCPTHLLPSGCKRVRRDSAASFCLLMREEIA